MVDMIRGYAARVESFAFETTLSGRGHARSILRWRARGYRVKLFFLRLPTPEMALARVRRRVAEGGHDVPEALVRRRFAAGWRNFERVYRALGRRMGRLRQCRADPGIAGEGREWMTKPAREKPQTPASDSDMAGAMAALQRAAMIARRRAVESGADAIPVFEDGAIVYMEVDKETLVLRRPRGAAKSGGEKA